MKSLNGIAIVALALLTFSCTEEAEGDAVVEDAVKSQKVEVFVEPIADFMSATEGVQLFSYFDQDSYVEESVTLEAKARTTGSRGKEKAIFLSSFTVNEVAFEPVIIVSEEDQKKVKDALDKVDKDGGEAGVTVVFEATLIKKGSMVSPFGGEINLVFSEGKVVSVN